MSMARGDGFSGALRRWLEARWYGDASVPFWLSGLSRVYGFIARRLRIRAMAQAPRLPVPVVVVGNITVGGTGKTPVVIALVEALRKAGFRPGIVSRGYGGSLREAALIPANADPAIHGDEPTLMKLRTGAPVAVGRDRVAAARLLLSTQEVDAIVSDDGLQHYRLTRDVEIVVVDGMRRFGNRRLLPAGPLREPTSRLDEADIVLVNGKRDVDERGFDLQLGDAYALDGSERRPLSKFAGSDVHAVAGIGNPQRFFDALRAQGLSVIEHAFPDHHPFVPDDFLFVVDAPVLMTEKDAVKCRTFTKPGWYMVPVDLDLPDAVVQEILSSWEVRARFELNQRIAADER